MENLTIAEILELIPHKAPFRFVDSLQEVDGEHAIGHYTFKKDSDYYKGHFDFAPVTPGVLITEAMAQIGLLPIGIYLLKESGKGQILPLIIKTEIFFEKMVLPGEKVKVEGIKKFYRYGILSADVTMYNSNSEVVAYGNIRGKIEIKP
jgi:3-hydroxyacyl-[acyl-carrier-protein] dehydratase